jgi:peptidoglycan/xylan/chitin deacetylase (PgdA/CDA1 family)
MSHCLVAMYHYVRETTASPFPAINALSVADFDRQLDLLAGAGDPLSCADLVRHLDARRAPARPGVLLTFDDGFVDHAQTVFPRLAARGWRAVFFLAGATLGDRPRVLNVHKTHFLQARLGADRFAASVRAALDRVPAAAGAGRAEPGQAEPGLERTDDVYRYDGPAASADVKHLLNYELAPAAADRVLAELFAEHIGDEVDFARALYLSADAIREMSAAGMTFGYHTATHRVLSRLDADTQRRELDGVSRIRELTGQRQVPFCFPYGHAHTFTAETTALLARFGYTCAFTTERRLARPDRDDRFRIPRFDTRDLPPFTSTMPDA